MLFEQLIGQGLQTIFGNSIWLGLLLLIWFGVLTLLQNLRLDAKLAILVPASLLAMVYLPMIGIIGAIIIAVVLFLAVEKFQDQVIVWRRSCPTSIRSSTTSCARRTWGATWGARRCTAKWRWASG